MPQNENPTRADNDSREAVRVLMGMMEHMSHEELKVLLSRLVRKQQKGKTE